MTAPGLARRNSARSSSTPAPLRRPARWSPSPAPLRSPPGWANCTAASTWAASASCSLRAGGRSSSPAWPRGSAAPATAAAPHTVARPVRPRASAEPHREPVTVRSAAGCSGRPRNPHRLRTAASAEPLRLGQSLLRSPTPTQRHLWRQNARIDQHVTADHEGRCAQPDQAGQPQGDGSGRKRPQRRPLV